MRTTTARGRQSDRSARSRYTTEIPGAEGPSDGPALPIATRPSPARATMPCRSQMVAVPPEMPQASWPNPDTVIVGRWGSSGSVMGSAHLARTLESKAQERVRRCASALSRSDEGRVFDLDPPKALRHVPSTPSSHALANTSAPSPSIASLNLDRHSHVDVAK